MKSIRIFITALLLAGSVAGNAQGVNDTKQDSVVYKYSTYCFESDKGSGSTKVIAFNPYTKTLFLKTPKGDKSKVDEASQQYLKKYKSLEGADYSANGEIRFANWDASYNFQVEAANKLKKKFGEARCVIVSYNAETGKPSYLVMDSSTYSFEIDKKASQGLGIHQSIDDFINEKTVGRYPTKEAFDKAYKAKELDALKYAEKMKRP